MALDLSSQIPSINGRLIDLSAHRGVTMAYSSIDGVPAPRRDDNWTLRASSRGALPSRMFAVDISGGYIVQPISLVIGDIITLDCTLPLVEPGYVAQANLRRPKAAHANGLTYHRQDGSQITNPASYSGAWATRWCPRLTMMVLDFAYSGDILSADSTWSYALEEVAAEATP